MRAHTLKVIFSSNYLYKYIVLCTYIWNYDIRVHATDTIIMIMELCWHLSTTHTHTHHVALHYTWLSAQSRIECGHNDIKKKKKKKVRTNHMSHHHRSLSYIRPLLYNHIIIVWQNNYFCSRLWPSWLRFFFSLNF